MMIDTQSPDFDQLMHSLADLDTKPDDSSLVDLWMLAQTGEGGTSSQVADSDTPEAVDRLENWVDEIIENLSDYYCNVFDDSDEEDFYGFPVDYGYDETQLTSWRINMALYHCCADPNDDEHFMETRLNYPDVTLFAEPKSFDWRHDEPDVHGVLIVNGIRQEFDNPEDMGQALLCLIKEREG